MPRMTRPLWLNADMLALKTMDAAALERAAAGS